AIDFQVGLDWERIRERIGELTRCTRQHLDGLAGLTVATPAHPALHGALTAFRLPAGIAAAALRRGLWAGYRIEAAISDRPEGLLIRVSTHFYNTEEESDRLAEALTDLLARCQRG